MLHSCHNQNTKQVPNPSPCHQQTIQLKDCKNTSNINSQCVVPENIHTPPTEGFWFASPPTLRNFRSKGVFDDPPPPQEFPRYANMVFVVTFTVL